MYRTSVYIITALLGISTGAFSQQTRIFTDPQAGFKQAKAFFQNEQYSLAYPLFKELKNNMRSTDQSNNSIVYDDVQFYTIACGLQQNETFSAEDAKTFISLNYNPSLTQRLSFYLGEYFYRKNEMREALDYYEQTSVESLSNRQIADMKFHQGYAYFTLRQFDRARPLLETIAKSSSDPNNKPANYYYGLIAYSNRNYNDGLSAPVHSRY